jgi:hypothetical protein
MDVRALRRAASSLPFDFRSPGVIAACFGVVVLIGAALYLLLHPITYRSDAEVTVTPRNQGFSSARVASTLETSGAVGTFAEVLSTIDPEELGFKGVTAKVRPVPASRALKVTTWSKDKGEVRPALRRVLASAGTRESALLDVWRLRLIERPSGAKRASVDARFVMSGALLAALFGSVALYILIQIVSDSRRSSSTGSTSRRSQSTPARGPAPGRPGYARRR